MLPVDWAAAAADVASSTSNSSVDSSISSMSSSNGFAIDLMHFGCLGLSVCYMALALFPVVSLARMITASTCVRKREEHTPLVQRDFAAEGATHQVCFLLLTKQARPTDNNSNHRQPRESTVAKNVGEVVPRAATAGRAGTSSILFAGGPGPVGGHEPRGARNLHR